ncbi:prepilin-type N-terminal cleavage/methylation domain-containing protein [Nocardioides sp. QY071]|uniref:prepilin-type N-terminal cleavage/methylation domain-containing protein n=1 Tax=Nocardioides sp. QY071 TaxID=3044187 RepID=UPI00249B3110|nr:prepilin-type N-terminal cleavage/methylation domain-containing protein [Nocardioides sp. QY071]WGY00243.1 prepilin-type N-terminal cleavage/methylation domain-containing protein [Nocardioides sp. QY071]
MRRLSDRLSAARRNDGGFTLIELLIVIIILGVLAAIVVFSVRGITDKGETSACKTSKATVATAYEAFVASEPNPNVAPAATVKTVESLYPDWLHSNLDGDSIGSVTISNTTTVDDVDKATC